MQSLYMRLSWIGVIFMGFNACVQPKIHLNSQQDISELTQVQESKGEIKRLVYFLGNTAQKREEEALKSKLLKAMQDQMQTAKSDDQALSLLILGNMTYPGGIAPEGEEQRIEDEKSLEAIFQFQKILGEDIWYIPGLQEWGQGRIRGLEKAQKLQKYIRKYLENIDEEKEWDESRFNLTCPGPQEYMLEEDLVLVSFNTQWWLHQWERTGIESDCEIKDEAGFLAAIYDVVRRHKDHRMIVAAHHPIFSNGRRGGHYPAYKHFLPPVLGTLSIGYHKVIGNIQDLSNPHYRQMRKAMKEAFSTHPNLVYVSAAENSQQYHPQGNWHHVISSLSSEASFVSKKKKAEFLSTRPGFSRLVFYEDASCELEFWTLNEKAELEQSFRRKLYDYERKAKTDPLVSQIIDYSDSTRIQAIGAQYAKASKFKRWLFGDNYRSEWAEEVEFPYFDIGQEKGGLKVIKKGGGQATNSLRLEAKDGRQYVLRSVNKQGDKALPEAFKDTFVADIVQDQTSAAYPYGALVVPHLASQVGVYHAKPRYVYLPQDPRLGQYQYTFGDDIYLFEERADDEEWEDAEYFGNAPDIESTSDVIEDVMEDNDEKVDQMSVLKHRLFDIWIGDWDRHDDQWRWAEYENKKEDRKYYQPIPRDRDQTFFDSDGWLMDFASHEWGIPKFQGFKSKIRSIEGYNFNGRYFDRFFLTETSLEDWLAMADTLQKALSDEEIDQALQAVPAAVLAHNGDKIRAKLIQRRADLPKYAREYYLFLARYVNVLGSDKHEEFHIERLTDEETRVRIYKVKKDDRERKHLFYDRTFKRSETKEIRIYGLDGEDEFILEGKVEKGIKIRIIGGKDKDKIKDASAVLRGGKKTIVYDKLKSTELTSSLETKSRLSPHSEVNLYDRYEFKYNYLGPQLFLGFNVDDGIFIGGGVDIKRHGFRKDPFKAHHNIKANFAFATNSFNILYQGEFSKVLGKLDFYLEADLRSPNYVQNFFGLGNESINLSDELGITYYRVRYTQWLIEPQLQRKWQDGKHRLRVGGFLQNIDIEENEGRFITNFDENGLEPRDVLEDNRYFGGFSAKYYYSERDNDLMPTRGLRFNAGLSYYKGLNEENIFDINFWRFSGDISVYQSLGRNLTIAARVGAAHNAGDFEFFQANTLGGKNNLRGFRNYRFSGRTSFYQNTDVRLRLFMIRSFLFNGYFGLLGIHDVGRVWSDGENSDKWHQGYGGGIWFTPAQALVVSTTYTFSDDDDVIFLRFGFLF